MKLRHVVFSSDFIVSALLVVVALVMLPTTVPNEFAKDLYGIGISVLSIVFSVYFAALAIIISSSDDDFVRFLEKDGSYTVIVGVFKWTLGSLLTGLVYSLVSYGITAGSIALCSVHMQGKWYLAGFFGVTAYGLMATAQSTMDAIRYSEHRIQYLKITGNDKR